MPETTTATFERAENGRAVVRLGDTGELATLRMVGSYMPMPEDLVRITRSGSETVVDGLATPRQPVGVIEQVRAPVDGRPLEVVVRSLDDRLQNAGVADHVVNPTPGDTVLVFAGYVIGRITAAAT